MSEFSTILPSSFSYNHKVLMFEQPLVMGILNLTPDSFYANSRYLSNGKEAVNQAEKMLEEGVHILDIGSASTRPGAEIISAREEWNRMEKTLMEIRKTFPSTWISIDTYNSETAVKALDAGADMINDISAGNMDSEMLNTIASFQCPYVLMHMKGMPATMQEQPTYLNVVEEVMNFFNEKLKTLADKGIHQVVLDPGFGFGKSLEHNYTLLKKLSSFTNLQKPLMVGLSRKSMVTRLLNVHPNDALNGTTALHLLALLNGAKILRVHDVREAVECIDIFNAYNK